MPTIFHWKRTFEDTSHDFSASLNGENIGRIYRHWDKQRWQWFYQRDPASTGVADSKDEAVAALEQAYEKQKSPAAGGPRGS